MSDRKAEPKKLRTRWGAGRAAFFAQIDELREMVMARHSLKVIYEERASTLGGVTYKAFCKLVKKHIGRPSDETKGGGERAGSGVVSPAPATQAARYRATGGSAGTGSGGDGKPGPGGSPPPASGRLEPQSGIGFPRVTHDPNSSTRKDLV